MSFEPRLIAPYEDQSGLSQYFKPWIIGDQAFPVLENAYILRGTVRKRDGYDLLGTVPTTPVMGLCTRIIPNTLDEQLIAFSTTRSYLFNTGTGVFDDISFFQTSGAAITWTGSGSDYFWSCNYQSSFWATNNIDPVRFYNGSALSGWNNQRFQTNGTPDYVLRALIVIPYRGRLVLLNTNEGPIGAGIQYSQRARWSQIGTSYMTATGADPVVVPPNPFLTDANSWRDDIAGRGGYIDAPTTEKIVSAAIINDILIVGFQRSVWRLRYTGNRLLPFVWEKITNNFGAEATFSSITIDKQAFFFSRLGYITTDSNSADRIDLNIPDYSFSVETGANNNQLQQVQGIREYYKEFIYWTFPEAQTNAQVPNKTLAYNWRVNAWSVFDVGFRVFGNYKAFNDVRWQDLPIAWEERDEAWYDPSLQDNFPRVVGAHPTTGAVYTLFENGPTNDNGTNFGFDIRTKQFNPYIAQGMRCRLQYVDLYCTSSEGGEVTVEFYINDDIETPVMTRTVLTSRVGEQSTYTRVYCGIYANLVQIRIYLTDAQIADDTIGNANFELQGLVIWTRPGGRIRDNKPLL